MRQGGIFTSRQKRSISSGVMMSLFRAIFTVKNNQLIPTTRITFVLLLSNTESEFPQSKNYFMGTNYLMNQLPREED